MNLIKDSVLLSPRNPSSLFTITRFKTFFFSPLPTTTKFYSHFWTFPHTPLKSLNLHVKEKNSESEPLLEPTIVQQVAQNEEKYHVDNEFVFEYEDESQMVEDVGDGDEYYEDEEDYEDENTVPYAGDGEAGGGISLAGTWWDKKALAVAKEVTMSFGGDLQIYAFKTLLNSTIRVRIEKLSNKSGSPAMEDIEAFSTIYRAKLDEAELAKFIPENLSLEVSSPGVERVVRIPDDLDRFKDRVMYVKYAIDDDSNNPSAEGDGVFKLESFDTETKYCTWSLANVRVNREKAGKGRPLNKKQREWRLSTPFDSLRFVRLHSDV